MNNNSSSLQGIKVILKHMVKYWYFLIFVAIFIIAATWLQVKAPLLLGDSIDDMVGYVTINIQEDTYNDIYDDVMAGRGIDDDTLDDITNALTSADDLSDSEIEDIETQLDQVSSMSDEELEQFFELYTLQYEIFEIDPDAIENGDGFTDEQLTYISDNASIEEQYFLASLTPENLQENQELIDGFIISNGDIDEKYDTFLTSVMYLAASYLALAVANFLYNILMARVSSLTSRDLRNNLFKKLETLSIRFFDQSNDGDVLSRFTNDIDNINNALNQTLTQVLSQVALLIGVIIMMFNEDETTTTIFGHEIENVLSWQLIGFALIGIFIAIFIVKAAVKYVSIQQNKLGALNGFIDERLSAQKVIITNDLHEETVEGFTEYNDDFRDTSFKGQVYSGMIMPLMTGIGLINLAFLTFTGSNQVLEGVMTVGTLTAFVQYSQRFFQPLGQIFSQYNILQLAVSGAARINDILIVEPEILEVENPIEIDSIKGNVVLDNVSFGYYPDKPVLKNVNIEVEHGKKVALVGPTGSGKTTVMNLLNRFYDIDEGEIRFGETNIKDMTLYSLRKNVGIVLQESVLFTGTIAENIAYGDTEASMERIVEAAKTANIHDFIMTLDQAYDTQISNNTTLFSVGQKQLMSIARTILTDPDLLILDEATSNVDTVTEASIQAAMENVMKNRTSFVIAHRLKTILDSDVIVVLKDGEVIEQGSHDELIKYDGFYAELYNNQFVLE